MVLVHSDIPRIHKALKDVKHDLCAALAFDGNGYSNVVAEADTGRIIAWDGWYFDHSEDEGVAIPEATALADLDWQDWDDMPTKLLIRSTSQWANDRMAFWLIPTFSPARQAATMVWQCEEMDTSGNAVRSMNSSRVVAYLPITDRDVYDRELSSKRQI
jgi:hypothetical protein